jgi:hypothetical protein
MRIGGGVIHATLRRASSRLIQPAIWFQLLKIWAINLINNTQPARAPYLERR